MRFQCVVILLLASISMSVALKLVSEEMQAASNAGVRDYDNLGTSQRAEKFPRVCGIHGWKKCKGRRRSSSAKVIFNFGSFKSFISL